MGINTDFSILRISHLAYAHALELAQECLACPTYTEKVEYLNSLNLTYGDSFIRSMRALGVSSNQVFYDFPALQEAWANEHVNLDSTLKYDSKNILVQQIISYSPTILYFQHSYHPFTKEELREIRDLVPSIKQVVVHNGYKCRPEHLADADLVLSGYRCLYDHYSLEGLDTELFYHYFDEAILDTLPESKPYLTSFIGSSGFGVGGGHDQRYWLLYSILSKSDQLTAFFNEENLFNEANNQGLDPEAQKIYGKIMTRSERHNDPDAYIASAINKWLGRQHSMLKFDDKPLNLLEKIEWKIDHYLSKVGIKRSKGIDMTSPVPYFPLSYAFPNKIRPAVFGNDYYVTLANSVSTLNIHPDFAQGYAGAMRVFQATGCGTCLIDDSFKDMQSLFEPGSEVLIYKSQEECIDILKFVKENPDRANAIGVAAQKKCISAHTSMHRCKQLLPLLLSRC